MMRKILMMMLAVLLGGGVVMAKKKAPKSQLKSFSYNMGGGMEIRMQDEVSLWQNMDGRRTLTLRGSCYYERITFEVGEDVFLHCDSIIHATKLYESKGYYKPEMLILDAPTTGFSVTYTDSKENFSGDGDMPDEIWKGMEAVVNYLKSLRGGREAKGHLATREWLTSTELIKDTEWIDGGLIYKPEDDAEELFRFLSQNYGFDYVRSEWELRLAEGSGQRCIILINYHQDIYDVFIDKATAGVKMVGTDDMPGRWPQTSQRVLTKSEIADMPTDSLALMADEIYARHYRRSPLRNDERDAYFKAQPWYNSKLEVENEALNDIEYQNFDLIRNLIERRKLEAQK